MLKKNMPGQINIDQYIQQRYKNDIRDCGMCACRNCLYWWSSRCPYGGCFDDYRAKTDPYDKAHPSEPPRTAWSYWNKPGEQAHWCRGGILYPAYYCERFVKYAGCEIQECIDCNIQVFQDGYIICPTKELIGCEDCIARQEGRENQKTFSCEWMRDTGCEKMIAAKNLMLDAIAAGAEIELCREQCCIGCRKICKYRCGQA